MATSDPFQMCGQPLDTYKFVTTTAHTQSLMALSACGSIHSIYGDHENSGIKQEPGTPTNEYLQLEFHGKAPKRSCKRKIEFNPLEDMQGHGTTMGKPTAKRNERERNRVRTVNSHFAKLREQIPTPLKGKVKKMSKVDILRAAMEYIKDLQGVLHDLDENTDKNCNRIGSMSSNSQGLDLPQGFELPGINNRKESVSNLTLGVSQKLVPQTTGGSDIKVEIPSQCTRYPSSLSASPHCSQNIGTYSPHSNGSLHSQEGYSSSSHGNFHQTMGYTLNIKCNSEQKGADLLQMVPNTRDIQGHLTSSASIKTGSLALNKEHITHLGQAPLNYQNALFADDMFHLC